jgi:hypothetical protein
LATGELIIRRQRERMDNPFIWLLIGPLFVLLILFYLTFFAGGMGFVVAAFRSATFARKIIFLLLGLGVIFAPFAGNLVQRTFAEQNATKRQEQLAGMDRTDLAGKLPRKFVTVGNYSEADMAFIRTQYRMSQFPPDENDRLAAVYRHFRAQEYCLSHSSGKTLAPGIDIPICKDIPDTIQEALGIGEPVLFFAEGSSTSYRRSNILVGAIYEVRLITPAEDLLVDYFEQTTIDAPASIMNPYSSGQRLKPDEKPPTRREFIQAALEGASR